MCDHRVDTSFVACEFVSTSPGDLMSESESGERVTPVLDFPAPGGRVNAIRVDYTPGGYTDGTHRHPAGAYVYVIEGSVLFGLDDHEPFVLHAGESFYEPPGALHSVSRNASDDRPASLIAFFVLSEGQVPTVYGAEPSRWSVGR
jgi:quercetin dioxygenase-like cupin family protein